MATFEFRKDEIKVIKNSILIYIMYYEKLHQKNPDLYPYDGNYYRYVNLGNRLEKLGL